MKFVDTAEIQVKGGHGGAGVISFRREKYVPKGGPDGGNGGHGGKVIIRASQKIQTLMDLKLKRIYKAMSGKNGGPKDKTGANGQDLVIKVPCGTMIFDEENNILGDLMKNNDSLIVAEGGRGGKGNAFFASAKNRAPRVAQPGLPGEEKLVSLELKLMAQIGLVGLPNAGKSTLLKTLTHAQPKIANYPFTTLYPNLGVLHYYDKEIVLADIPGLIEGSAQGLGLGHDFLRHVARTQMLLHLISVEDQDAKKCWQDYVVISKELAKTSQELAQKEKIVLLSKVDIIETNKLKEIRRFFKDKGMRVICISSFSNFGIPDLVSEIYKIFNENENQS